MKAIIYRVLNVVRYTLCGSCEKGIEWEYELDHAPSQSLCYCTHDSYTNLIKQFIKRKVRRKDEPIF